MKRPFVAVIVALATLFAACTSESTSDPTTAAPSAPTTTIVDPGIALVDYRDLFGIEGLIPEGWVEFEYGAFARGELAADPTFLVLQAAPNATTSEVLDAAVFQLELAGRPESSGTVRSDVLEWTVYEFEAAPSFLGRQELRGELAVAETDYGSFIAGIVAPPDELDSLAAWVLDPVVRAFTPPPQLAAVEPNARYLDPSVPIDQRVDDLLDRMTLGEKIGQMTQVEKNSLFPGDITAFGIGSVLSGGGAAPTENTPAAWAKMVDEYQDEALATRLAVPLIYGVDAVHGHNNVRGATVFPHNVGLGAANDPDLMRRIGEITAAEVAATGIHWNFAPTVAVPQDIRWGRTYEGYGEDTELVVSLSAAYLEGLQGDGLSDPMTVLATPKHFVGDGGTTWGSATTAAQLIDQGVTEVDEATLRSVHLPPYIEAIERGAQSVMVSFSSWNDTRMHASRYLVTEVLKDELAFDGFIVSDWAAIDQISPDYYEAVVMAFNAGIDMNMVPYDLRRFVWTLWRAVDNGDVSIERIDDAVRRILRVKFELGLFESPYSDPGLLSIVGSDTHRAVAREAVAKSAVLLVNDDQVLPIGDDVGVIFVGGQAADDIGIQSGGWTIEWQGREGAITPGTTILEGIRATAGDDVEVYYDKFGNLDRVNVEGGASAPDVCIGVVGERPYAEFEGDSADLAIVNRDLAVFDNLNIYCDRIVVVLVSGRPLLISDRIGDWDALVAAWLPGSEGQGVADVLFGREPFVGRLPYTWPATIDQVPLGALDASGKEPLFPYGFGLEP